jgi:hypothetical protein
VQASFVVSASVSDVRNACGFCQLVSFPEAVPVEPESPELELHGHGVKDDEREIAVRLRARANARDAALMMVELEIAGNREAAVRKLGEHIESTVTRYVRAPADFLFERIAYLAMAGLQNVDTSAFQRVMRLLTQVARADPAQVATRLGIRGDDLARVAAVEALGRAGQVEELAEALERCANPLARVLAWNWLAKLETTLSPWPLEPHETPNKVEFFVPVPGALRTLAWLGISGAFFALLLGSVALAMASWGGVSTDASFLTRLAEARFVWFLVAFAFLCAVLLGRWALRKTVDRYYDVAPGDVIALVVSDRTARVFGWVKPSASAAEVGLRQYAVLAPAAVQGFFLTIPGLKPRRFAPMAFPPVVESLLQP